MLKKEFEKKSYYRTDARQIENGTNDWYSSEKIDSHGEKATEENNETVSLNDHADERVSQKNH